MSAMRCIATSGKSLFVIKVLLWQKSNHSSNSIQPIPSLRHTATWILVNIAASPIETIQKCLNGVNSDNQGFGA